MSVLENVLREELERMENNLKSYKEILSTLPKGSIYIRRIHNSEFVYRTKRENNKLITEYIGAINSQKAKEAINKSNEYKSVKEDIRALIREITKLRRALKAYDRK